jgi:hypothetical protein
MAAHICEAINVPVPCLLRFTRKFCSIKSSDKIFKKSLAFRPPFKIKMHVYIKGIVSPDWKGLQMVSLDRFEV